MNKERNITHTYPFAYIFRKKKKAKGGIITEMGAYQGGRGKGGRYTDSRKFL